MIVCVGQFKKHGNDLFNPKPEIRNPELKESSFELKTRFVIASNLLSDYSNGAS